MASIASLFGGEGGHSSHEHYGLSQSGIPAPDVINGQRETYVQSLDHQKSEALGLLETQRDQQVDFIEQAKLHQIHRLKSEISEKAHHHEHNIKQVHKEADSQRKKAVEELDEQVREQEEALHYYKHNAHAQKQNIQKEIDQAEAKKAKALKEHHEEVEHETHHLIYEIEEKAKQQEMALRHKYSNLQMTLEKQALEKKVSLEKQAVDLAIEWKTEKAAEEARHHWLAHQPSVWKYFPDHAAPIDIRQTPAINGPRSGCQLTPGETFQVSKEMCDHKLHITFLKLSDGRGWVFDSKPGVGTMCVRMDQQTLHGGHHGGHNGDRHDLHAGHGGYAAHGAHGHGAYGTGTGPLATSSSMALPTMPAGASMWVHKPDFLAPLQIRREPAVDAERTEHMLMPGEAFAVTDELVGQHDVRYLKLADGRGWVFDRKAGVGMMCYRQSHTEGGAVGSAAPAPSVYAPSMGGSAFSRCSSFTAVPLQTIPPGGSYVPPAQPPMQVIPPTLPSGFPGYAQAASYTLPAQALGSLDRSVRVPVSALGSAYVGANLAPEAAQTGLGNSQYLGCPADPMSPRVIGTRVTVYR